MMVDGFDAIRTHSATSALSDLWQFIKQFQSDKSRYIEAPMLISGPYVIRDPKPLTSFREHLRLRGAVRTSILYTRDILDALSFLHSIGINHGAVKPENIIIVEDKSMARLTDLGLSTDALSDDTVALTQCAFEAVCQQSALDVFMHTWTADGPFWVHFINSYRKTNSFSEKIASMLLDCDFIKKDDLRLLFQTILSSYEQ